MALSDLGLQSMVGTNGEILPEDDDLSSLSMPLFERLMKNRTQPSSWVFRQKNPDGEFLRLKGYNHISEEEYKRQDGTKETFRPVRLGVP